MKWPNILNLNREFPEISFDEFQSIPYIDERKKIVKKNKILRTDAYNRTMDYTKEEKWNQIESFFLSLRKSPNTKYNVIYWVKSIVDEVLRTPFSQNELDFAKDYYEYQTEKWWNWKFNPDRWQKVINENQWMLPIKVFWVEDWTVLKPWEPAIRVEWEAELAAIYEPIFMRLFYKSIVATNAMMIEEIIWEWRVVEFWYRSAINDDMHIDAMESLTVWWWIVRTSSDVTAAALDLITDGTTAHRYFTAFPTEDEAMEQAIIKNDKIALLVDSVEAYNWIDKIVNLKKKYKDERKVIAPRLDSWDLAKQAIYALKEFQKAWFTDPTTNKIVVADIGTIDDIIEIEEAVKNAWFNPKDYIVYGLWGLLIAREKTRDVVSAWFKLSNTENGWTMKFSNDKWKISIPWKPNIEMRNWKRYIVQEDENIKWVRLLQPMYDSWNFFYDKPKISDINKARNRMKKSMNDANLKTEISKETQDMIEEIKQRVWIL